MLQSLILIGSINWLQYKFLLARFKILSAADLNISLTGKWYHVEVINTKEGNDWKLSHVSRLKAKSLFELFMLFMNFSKLRSLSKAVTLPANQAQQQAKLLSATRKTYKLEFIEIISLIPKIE